MNARDTVDVSPPTRTGAASAPEDAERGDELRLPADCDRGSDRTDEGGHEEARPPDR